MIIYYAELHYDRYTQDMVGVFSSTEKAQAACLNDAIADELRWEAQGDCIIAEDSETGCDYIIYPLTLDKVVKK